MSNGAWWNAKNVKVVDRPKPEAPSLRQQAAKMLLMLPNNKALRIPKRYFGAVQPLYAQARSRGLRQHVNRNGDYVYLWWTKR